MKLYEVNIECVAVVWAEDRRSADRQVERDINEALDGADFTASEIRPDSTLYSDWCGSVPFGDAPEGFENLTCNEIKDKWAEDAPAIDNDTLPLPGFA